MSMSGISMDLKEKPLLFSKIRNVLILSLTSLQLKYAILKSRTLSQQFDGVVNFLIWALPIILIQEHMNRY